VRNIPLTEMWLSSKGTLSHGVSYFDHRKVISVMWFLWLRWETQRRNSCRTRRKMSMC